MHDCVTATMVYISKWVLKILRPLELGKKKHQGLILGEVNPYQKDTNLDLTGHQFITGSIQCSGADTK